MILRARPALDHRHGRPENASCAPMRRARRPVIVSRVITVHELTKRYRSAVAVNGLSFSAPPGQVTGFLGPNGAGKSTVLRVILGLDAPTSGQALVAGRPYAALSEPLRQVGALLDAGAVHPGRSALSHLGSIAAAGRIGKRRVTVVLEQVGLAGVARRRVGEFSLGMRQRLGIAAALLSDPAALIFDEPVNGLDPDGVRWARQLMRTLASEGRTVLVSSHLIAEMELTADRLVIIGHGKLIAETSLADLTARHARGVRVRTSRTAELASTLAAAGATVTPEPDGALTVSGPDAAAIAGLAAAGGIPLYELVALRATLEEAYTQITAGTVDHHARPSHSWGRR
jgi:ABC-2 type transport system ATP-binding protein